MKKAISKTILWNTLISSLNEFIDENGIINEILKNLQFSEWKQIGNSINVRCDNQSWM